MDRNERLKKFVAKEMAGIECGPWKSPLCPKNDGYNCFVLDVFSTNELLQRAQSFNMPDSERALIEPVDLVGSAQDIFELASPSFGSCEFDYVISSHNFEHIPNPIKFLIGCGKLLRPTGVVSMAIPIKNYCFDALRELSRVSDLLAAYAEERIMPSNEQVFDHLSSYVEFNGATGNRCWFTRSESLRNLIPSRSLSSAHRTYLDRLTSISPGYLDVHCWTFTPKSFELIMHTLWLLGVIPLRIIDISDDIGCEFIAHLSNSGYNLSEISCEDYHHLHQLKIESIKFNSFAFNYD